MKFAVLITLLISINTTLASPDCLYFPRVVVANEQLSQFIQTTNLYHEMSNQIYTFGPFHNIQRTDQVVLYCVTKEGVVLHLNSFATIRDGDWACGYDSLSCSAGFIHVTNAFDKIFEENVTASCKKETYICSDR